MSDQDNGQVSTLQRPTTDDPEAWKAYWKAQGWPWRTEPEIDAERQKFLAERRTIVPDIKQGIYPFKNIKLSRADVSKGYLEGANFREAHLEGAELYRTHLEGVYLRKAHLGGASLRKAIFDSNTSFDGVSLENEEQGCALVADVNWNGMNITNVNWTQIKMLGDDSRAFQLKLWKEEVRNSAEQVSDYQRAVRANRQLAAILQGQGLNEEVAHFSYHAQKLQRAVLWRQKKFISFFFSLFLDLLAGFGYRPGRSVIWYLVTILGFAIAE